MGCQVCRARKVKCNGQLLHGCLNCARLDLACDLDRSGGRDANRGTVRGGSGKSASASPSKAKRIYRSCTTCRAAKTKCNGDQPACLRCRARSIPCVYGATSGPLWTQVLQNGQRARGSPLPGSPPNVASAASEQAPGESAAPATAPASTRVPTTAYPIPQDGLPPPISSPSVSFAMDTNTATPVRRRISSSSATLAGIAQVPVAPALDTTATRGNSYSNGDGDSHNEDDTHALTWLYAAQLPHSPGLLRRVVDHYFINVHPLRCFAFVHKPTFMRQLDGNTFALPGSDDMALLQAICAHGAKFCALEYSEAIEKQPAKLIQAAGHEWAKAAEQTLMTNYGRITVTSLMTAVLLYDYRYRLGDFAHALIMSGLTTRMAHALQLNMEHVPRTVRGDSSGDGENTVALSAVEKEARRRLMWACYVIDTWTGSGMDQLTLLREDDLYIQLPCNEREFLFQRTVVVGRLGDDNSNDNNSDGMLASYVRLVSIWKRVARYVKHLDTAALPWLPGSEFAVLDDTLRAWRDSLAPYLDFSQDSIYTRLESSQLGALALLHCTYYNALLDLYRIAMPELFSLRHAFHFPAEQADFLHNLQARSFQNASGIAAVLAKTAAQGARHLADSMTPMFAYNSSRVLLYYLVRLHDPGRADTKATVEETIQHVQSNNRVLHLASAMMPLSEPLLVTARGWLQKLQSGLHKQQDASAVGAGVGAGPIIIPPGSTDIPGMADDPAAGDSRVLSRQQSHSNQQHQYHNNHDADNSDGGADSGADSTDTPDNVLHPLSLFRLARKKLNDTAYSEPSSRASYAGGGLPPLRDVAAHTGHASLNNRSASPMLERTGNGVFSASAPPTEATPVPDGNVVDVLPSTATPSVAVPVTLAPTPGGTSAFNNWESAFDDLAMGLHVLQDYPHWEVNGFEHISSSSVFDSNGLATWPEYRGRP